MMPLTIYLLSRFSNGTLQLSKLRRRAEITTNNPMKGESGVYNQVSV